MIEKMFERWLAEAKPGDKLVYYRGLRSQKISFMTRIWHGLADRLLELSNGRYDVFSNCGHFRGEIVGSKDIELLTRRERGETIYLAIKR